MSEHAGYIWAAYALTFVVIGGFVVSILSDYHKLKRHIAALPARDGGDPDA